MGAKNKSVLDIGCGQGVYSRALAEAGARVTGIDASPSLIEAARRYQSKVPVKYECENAEDLRAFADQSFDQVSAILCIQNMRNLDRVTSECARVLRPNGRMLWVLNHPCFRIPRQTSWGFDEGKKMQYRRIDMYMSPAEIPIQMHPGKHGTESTVSFHRSITDLFSIASRFSFAAVKVEEWSSTRSSQPGPRAKAENRARKEFPLFMAVLFQLVVG
ncbi:MAG TPA: class I SAM-dependent methyltransferase [Leptospiraceae bacterium]|nr:class I SAM-dependent methyltransferase [Leptospiraceae bacterium]HNJ04077.1 class I SAM-dependent methyltransferase [Leptospiraceae bacterium]HNL00425.1 class I SAM-dependent methyltransferase [Leptospiraceae bacterium]